VNIGAITTSVHAGTHADAPLHVESSWSDSACLPATAFIGEVCVIALPSGANASTEISTDALTAMIGKVMGAADSLREIGGQSSKVEPAAPSRVLCRTGYSVANGAFPDAWPILSASAAAWLVSQGILLWGTDAPSVDERNSKALPVHHALFAASAFVLENLSLGHVVPGVYELLAQPISIEGADAAPVRAMLRALP